MARGQRLRVGWKTVTSETDKLADIISFIRNFQNGGYADLIIELCKARITELEKTETQTKLDQLKELAKLMESQT